MDRRLVKIDRRYKNPYRRTAYANRLFLKWVGLFALVVILGMTANYVGLVCLLLYLAYAALSIVRWRRERSALLAPPQLAYRPPGQPLGERNSRSISQDVKIAVSVRDGGRCRLCGSVQELHYDHVVPWSRGGANTVANIQLLCGPCNRAKGARDDTPLDLVQ